jgi:hypothetical protein
MRFTPTRCGGHCSSSESHLNPNPAGFLEPVADRPVAANGDVKLSSEYLPLDMNVRRKSIKPNDCERSEPDVR